MNNKLCRICGCEIRELDLCTTCRLSITAICNCCENIVDLKNHVRGMCDVCDQIPSQNILFIDDKQENLDVAKLFDMETILFTSDDYESGLIEEKILNFLN